MTTLHEACLPDGTSVYAVRPGELATLYEQVHTYCRHGICVQEGDIVFDVGANVGLFALWLRQSAGGNVTVYSFEPIPEVFEALRCNAERFGPQSWKAFPYGLGRCSGTITFGYCRGVTAMSTAYPDASSEAVHSLRDTLLRNVDRWPPGIRWMRHAPRFLLRPFLDYVVGKALVTEEVECPVRTVSEMIREEQIPRIDLLKVDVEKAELDVLEGIEAADWPLIRQVAVEVHDLDGRLARITTLLHAQGFATVEFEQDPLFEGSEIYNLYALRAVSDGAIERRAKEVMP